MIKSFSYALVLLLVFFSCNEQEKSAVQLLAQAQSHYEAKEYFAAKSCLDSLKAGYPKQIAEQKQALQLMRRIDLSEQERNLLYMDSLLPIKENEIVELRKKFVFQKDAQYEDQGKYLSPQQVELMERQVSCLRSGVREDGLLYLASRYCGSIPLEHRQIIIRLDESTYTQSQAIPKDGGLNYSFVDGGMYTEIVTYLGEKAEEVVHFVCDNKDKKLQIEYVGKKHFKMNLSQGDKQSIYLSANLATAMAEVMKIGLEKEKSSQRIKYLKEKLDY